MKPKRFFAVVLLWCWTFGCMLPGAWFFESDDLQLTYGVIFLAGLCGLWSGALAFYLKTGDKEIAAGGVGFLGIFPLLVFSAACTYTVPRFKVVLSLGKKPVSIDLESLADRRPSLPCYARITGRLVELYRIQDRNPVGSGPPVIRTPMVPGDWQRADPVFVVTDDQQPNRPKRNRDSLVTVTGVLYPVVPRWTEAGWPERPRNGVGKRADWYIDKARFRFDVDYLLFLDRRPTTGLALPFILMIVAMLLFTLVTASIVARPRKKKKR